MDKNTLQTCTGRKSPPTSVFVPPPDLVEDLGGTHVDIDGR